MSRQEWLEWRQKGIGSSDAPIIMGVSPWKTPLQLFEEKTAVFVAEDNSNQYIKDRGNRIEPRVRALFEMKMGESFEPATLELEGANFIRASLDGLSEDKKRAIEIKLSGRKDWEETKKTGKLPEKYWPQVQHQLQFVDVVYYLSYLFEKDENQPLTLDNLAVVEVRRDDEYIAKLKDAEAKFWRHVLEKKPPIAQHRDYKPLTGYAEIAKAWIELGSKIEELEEKREALRKHLIDAAEKAGHPRLLCAGIRIRQESRAGNVQYAKIPELKGVDLDKYRGAGSVFWKLEIAKEEK